ncbi:MAG: 4Fe-4S binding protein [Desulfitobacterium hafniense]|nr:4Fe-4S binding protein [Desulfitobacterium hafniense]
MGMVNYAELKKGGFMKQIQKNRFSLRVRIVGGQIEADKLKKIYELSQKYGHGYVHLTSRQSIEIPFVKLEDVENIKQELEEAGLQPGACGPRVRTVTACQGSTVCPSGLIDVTSLAKEFDQKYHARELPHKFKLGLTACRNNCLKAEENDLGVKGGMKPTWDESKCSYCGLCEALCPTQAILVKKKEKELVFKEEGCIYCGKCVKSCPVDAWIGQSGFILYFGGMFGNTIELGKQIIPIIFEKEALDRIVEKTLDFYQEHGKQGERFGHTLDRVGSDLLVNSLKEALK